MKTILLSILNISKNNSILKKKKTIIHSNKMIIVSCVMLHLHMDTQIQTHSKYHPQHLDTLIIIIVI